MRHAEAEHNVLSIYNSDPAHPNYRPVDLTEFGRKQVRESAALLREHGIRSEDIGHARISPLPRTQQTALILQEEGLLLPAIAMTEQRLSEVLMGDREGTRYGASEDPYDHSKAQIYHGESDSDVRARVEHLVEELLALDIQGHILLVTHGSPALELIQVLSGSRRYLPTAGFQLIPFEED